VLAVVLLLFGGSGKISSIMSDVGKGIKSFKKGVAEDEPASSAGSPHGRRAEVARECRQSRGAIR
jgi:sec-independent protein translocase protein TatA